MRPVDVFAALRRLYEVLSWLWAALVIFVAWIGDPEPRPLLFCIAVLPWVLGIALPAVCRYVLWGYWSSPNKSLR